MQVASRSPTHLSVRSHQAHTAQQRDAQREGTISRGRPKVAECDRNCLLLPSSAWEFLDSFTGRSSSGQVQPEMRISKPHHNKGVDVHPS